MKSNQSKSRLESFSDAIFAFAATLLVVSLDVPENFTELKSNLSNFLSFAISFFALALIWKTHYNFFRRTDFIDNWVVAINMLLLFVVLFFVYPLKFLANLSFGDGKLDSYYELSELFQLYGLGFILIFLCFSLLYFYAAKKNKTNKKVMNFYGRHFAIFSFVGILSVITASLNVGAKFGLSGFIYFLIGPLATWHGIKYGIKKD